MRRPSALGAPAGLGVHEHRDPRPSIAQRGGEQGQVAPGCADGHVYVGE
jgi:hypothetical protein